MGTKATLGHEANATFFSKYASLDKQYRVNWLVILILEKVYTGFTDPKYI